MASFPLRQIFINATWRTSQLTDSCIVNLRIYAFSIHIKNELKMERYIYRSAYFLPEGTERISIISVLATNRPFVDLLMVRNGSVCLNTKPNLLNFPRMGHLTKWNITYNTEPNEIYNFYLNCYVIAWAG
jgi:hypothetical protein